MITVDQYLDRVTSQYRNQPKFIATLTALVQPFVDIQNLCNSMHELFDIDQAVGEQLDFLGQWVGITRRVNVPSFGDISLDDDRYRQIIKAKIAANHWDGTIPNALEIFSIVFGNEYKIIILDHMDMSITFGIFRTDGDPIDSLTAALFSGGYFDLRSAGVLVNGYLTAELPVFGFDYDNDFISGFDVGRWAVYV